MGYDITVRIDYVPKLPNRMGWSKWAKHNERKAWQMKVYRAFIGIAPKEPLQKSKVTITRAGASAPDTDNNYASVKPLVDALKRNAIIFDDAPQFIDIEVLFLKVKRKESHTIIKIEELE